MQKVRESYLSHAEKDLRILRLRWKKKVESIQLAEQKTGKEIKIDFLDPT
jgi:hypothetical protein